MYGVPIELLAVFMFFLGAIFGSFLDVFISRFHTGKSINGRSHCAACGNTLSWYELFPIFSYVFLQGRCRVCSAAIPARLFWMEVVTGGLFVSVLYAVSGPLALFLGCLFVILAVIITLYDVKHLVIPDVFVVAAGVLSIVMLLIDRWPQVAFEQLLPFLVSGLLASLFFGCLWFVSGGRWIGLGDAKLALPLGIMLNPIDTFSFVVLAFWVGAGVSVGILLIQWLVKRGQTYLRFLDIPLTMKSEVPFAPFLLIAFALVYFYHLDVLQFITITL